MNDLTTISIILTCVLSIISLLSVIVKITKVLSVMQEKIERTEIRLAGHSDKIDEVYKTLYEHIGKGDMK